ncbi:MAG: 4'-phosphopantetheinyl transferase superfamily protein [Bacteroidales bacterium]|jgi:phosphopantetheinyl transferase|nr:4'-phosphopantetheinyl transferase superfamily protein [Bacteroidales bacterium]MDD3736365.1 4'-phosphopantetheinyl transferase superfamily protein [Bacteroidales bacterium]NLD63464.1 4'-phosphopantetheinyl transferase superfamily protein [Bacteroidales bacterium]HNT93379.1 4'-phosphopantetheinyl transferase superfamily protein [Bacteroidales bacterium]HOO66443.1 4'-phosphopantetheinyl transferase superfamily protein [Bacteroidales bacterium]
MGCITKHYLNKDTIIGVWKIEEDLETLLTMVDMGPEDKKRYELYRSNSRKMEFLSVRALLAEMLGRDARIVYNKNNKPFIKDGSHFISITHSNKLTAILISKDERVGIDLEYMRVNINAFASKFLNRKEKVTRRWADRTYHLYIHWCAKEAIYKICDKEGINIVNDITIEPFDVKESGEIRGTVKNERIDDQFTLYYSKYDNYTIVWTKKKHED